MREINFVRFWYFMTAAASGCFGPDVAFRCLLQILLSRRTYVRMILVSLRTLETIRGSQNVRE